METERETRPVTLDIVFWILMAFTVACQVERWGATVGVSYACVNTLLLKTLCRSSGLFARIRRVFPPGGWLFRVVVSHRVGDDSISIICLPNSLRWKNSIAAK